MPNIPIHSRLIVMGFERDEHICKRKSPHKAGFETAGSREERARFLLECPLHAGDDGALVVDLATIDSYSAILILEIATHVVKHDAGIGIGVEVQTQGPCIGLKEADRASA